MNESDTNETNAIYDTIFKRRDVRGEYKDTPIPHDVISRILYAAHHAPSVGFMQPWDFILVKDMEVRNRIHQAFEKADQEAASMFNGAKRETYTSLKLEGILESPLNICLTCDTSRSGPIVIGRTHIPQMDTYSTVCAVQNLWLAARAEGLGVGWVSIIDEAELKRILNLPEHVVPVAYLCIGEVEFFHEKPELEKAGWLPRLPLDELIRFDTWQGHPTNEDRALLTQIKQDRNFPSGKGYEESSSC